MRPGTYLIVTLGLTAALVGGVLALNSRVDPYGLATVAASSEQPRIAEGARPGAFWRNAFTVAHPMPRTVILGTSRAEFGLDPRHPGFATQGRPVDNLALGGLSIEQIRLLLVHANTPSRLRMAVIGLDIESFLDEGRTDFDPAALEGNPESEPEALVRLRVGVSRETLAASVVRLSRSTQDDAKDRRAWRIPDDALQLWNGQRGVIWVAEYDNFYGRLPHLFPTGPAASRFGEDRKHARAMASFRDLLRYARSHDIELRLFMSPVHARYLEWYRRVGWWPLFEAWKRALVDAIDAESRAASGGVSITLWDFAGFHSISTESVPKLGDHHTRMRWYRDTSHYAPEVGDMILDRVLGKRDPDASPLSNAPVSRASIDADLAGIRSAAARYRLSEPEEMADLDDMLAYLRRVAKK